MHARNFYKPKQQRQILVSLPETGRPLLWEGEKRAPYRLPNFAPQS